MLKAKTPGRSIPAREQTAPAPRTSGEAPRPAGVAPDMPLPHERDETASKAPPAAELRSDMRRAARDVASGGIDTEARGTPSDVPRGTTPPPRSRK